MQHTKRFQTEFALFMLAIALIVQLPVEAKGRWKEYAANAQEVRYVGRIDDSAQGEIQYDWVGTYFETEFTGGTFEVKIADTGTTFYNIYVDGQCVRKICVNDKEAQWLNLANGLGKGKHLLRLQRCTEGEYGTTRIMGFRIASNGVLTRPAEKKRFIEVYGDSYTCGYGTESNKANDRFSVDTENCDKAYGCIIARYFDADYSLTAHSGQGIVRNWGDAKQISDVSMSHRVQRVMDKDGSKMYAFNRHRPDIVLINLGTNDFSPVAIPTPEQYAEAYMKLINLLRQHYGEVPVLCIEPHSANAYLHAALKEVRQRAQTLPKVFFANSLQNMVTEQYDMGADWHPNYQGQRKIASCLIPQISAIMSWGLEDKVIR